MAVSRDDILTELKREMKMRLHVYSRWVTEGKLKPDESAKRLERLQGAIDHFEAMPADQGSLL